MNLKECLEKNEMLLPNDKTPSIIDLMRVLYRYGGEDYERTQNQEYIEKYVKNKNNIIFILIDGMGSSQIAKLSKDSNLQKHKKIDLESVNPTSTACVLTSILTGEYPGNHGITGWFQYHEDKEIAYCPLIYKERYTRKSLDNYGIKTEDIYPLESKLNTIHKNTYLMFPNKIANSRYSKYTLQKTENRIGYGEIEEGFALCKQKIEEENNCFIYFYISDVDQCSHYSGLESSETKEKLEQIERGLEVLKLVKNKEIIITADHGQIEVDKRN